MNPGKARRARSSSNRQQVAKPGWGVVALFCSIALGIAVAGGGSKAATGHGGGGTSLDFEISIERIVSVSDALHEY